MLDDFAEAAAVIIGTLLLTMAFMVAIGITPWKYLNDTPVAHVHIEAQPHSYNRWN